MCMREIVVKSLLAIIYFSFCSCGNNVSRIVKNATVVKVCADAPISEFECDRVAADLDVVGAVSVHRVTDSEFVLMMMAGDYCLQWVDLAEGKNIGLLRRGNGPDEMDFAGVAGIWKNDAGDTIVSAYSINLKRVANINLTRSLSQGLTIVENSHDIPKHTMYVLADKDRMVSYAHTQDGVALHVLSSGSGQESIIFPFGNNGYWGTKDAFFAATSLADDGGMLMAMASFPRIYAIDLNTGKAQAFSSETTTDKSIIKDIEQKNLSDCYGYVAAAGNRIYALYTAPASGKKMVQVWQSTGNLEYSFEVVPDIVNFCILSDNKTLLGITINSELLRYKLER